MQEAAPVIAFIREKRMAKFEFELHPKLWERNKHVCGMNKARWKHVFFNDTNLCNIPKEPGIYMFVVAPRHAYLRDHTYIFYVGQANNLNRRYDNYLHERVGEDLEHDRERIVDFMDRFKGHIFFNYHTCLEKELDSKEDYLVDHVFPWANSRHKKTIKAVLAKPEAV